MTVPVFSGVFVATVTPFKTSECILDTVNYAAHLDRLAEAGVDGFVPCGTTGESATIRKTERKELIQISIEKAREYDLKVIAGCGSNNTELALAYTEEAAKLGADAALVVTPYYNKPTQEGLIAHYRFLADKSPIPIFLYNVPGRTNVSIQLSTLISLFQHPNIVGIKEASGQYSFWNSIASSIDLKKKLLFAGDDDAFVITSELGGRGIISATANVAPHEFVKLYQLILECRWNEAHVLQSSLQPLIKSMFVETNPAPAKFALSLMRKMENNLRLPLVKVKQDSEIEIESALKKLNYL